MSLVDPEGLASLNFFDPNPSGHDSTGAYAGGQVWNIPGVYTVAGHGNPGWMEDDSSGSSNARRLYPEDLAKIIKNDPNWKNRPVMLGGCNTGNSWQDGYAGKSHWDSFAQMLANALGVPVTAPLAFTRWNGQQGLTGTSPGIAGPVQYPGQWKTYY